MNLQEENKKKLIEEVWQKLGGEKGFEKLLNGKQVVCEVIPYRNRSNWYALKIADYNPTSDKRRFTLLYNVCLSCGATWTGRSSFLFLDDITAYGPI